MSASTTTNTTAPSQKRPLEDPSSDSGPSDQPDAKRPALDGLVKEDGANGHKKDPVVVQNEEATVKKNEDDVNLPSESASAEKDSAKQDPARPPPDMPSATAVLETQPIQSTVSANGTSQSSGPGTNQHQDESNWLHIRAIISSAEAATIIGKGGENVTMIRRMAGAKCTISEYSRGAVERVLTVSGLVDAVAKAFGLIIRTLNQESLDVPSNGQSKTYPLRLLVPHILIGSIIGQKGVRIREIQEASGARLNASDSCLPLSTERSLIVLGVADSVHIATYYIGSTLVNQLTEKFGGPAASAYATRSGGPAGVAPGGMQIVPYTPQPAGGQWGHPATYNQHHPQASRSTPGAFAQPQPGYGQQAPQPQTPVHYGGAGRGYAGAGPQAPHQAPYAQPPVAQQPGQPPMPAQGGAFPGQPLTQQIYIPNDMVGAIIGKGGAKINEIRQLSGSVIKINEPTDNSNERLVTITGTQECNQMALYMLYQRLESEKHRI